jgi:hypothetical protein
MFESSITGNILDDGRTTEVTGITAGQLATVLTAYTPLTDTAANTAAIGANSTAAANNAAAIAAQATQMDGKLEAPPWAPRWLPTPWRPTWPPPRASSRRTRAASPP